LPATTLSTANVPPRKVLVTVTVSPAAATVTVGVLMPTAVAPPSSISATVHVAPTGSSASTLPPVGRIASVRVPSGPSWRTGRPSNVHASSMTKPPAAYAAGPATTLVIVRVAASNVLSKRTEVGSPAATGAMPTVAVVPSTTGSTALVVVTSTGSAPPVCVSSSSQRAPTGRRSMRPLPPVGKNVNDVVSTGSSLNVHATATM
jgi:hypothetical protein